MACFADPGQIGLLFAAAEESELALPPLPSTSTTLATGEIVANLMAAASLDEDPQLELWATNTSFELISPL